MCISTDLLHIELGIYRHVAFKYRLAVFIATCDCKKPLCRNSASVCSSNLLSCIESKLNRSNLAILADSKEVILLHNLEERDLHLLALITKRC